MDPPSMGGMACIRRMQMPMAAVLAIVTEGMSEDQILQAHPDLEREAIRETLEYDTQACEERVDRV